MARASNVNTAASNSQLVMSLREQTITELRKLKLSDIKLSSVNYDVWKFKMRVALAKFGLEDFVNAEISEGDSDRVYKLQVDSILQHFIVSSVSDDLVCIIINCKSASQMWQALSSALVGNKEMQIWNSLNEIFANKEKFIQGMDMQAFVNSFKNRVQKLQSLGESIEDKYLTLLLLSSIECKSWESMKTTLIYRSNSINVPTFGEVTSALIMESIRRKPNATEQANMATNKKRTANSKKASKKQKLKCDHCGKTGHIAEKCYKLHPELMPTKLKKKQEEKEREGESNLAEDFGFLATEEDKPSVSEISDSVMKEFDEVLNTLESQSYTSSTFNIHFILDSGCTSHLVKSNQYLSNYVKELQDKYIFTANGGKTKVSGRGSLRIVTDQNKIIVLKEVLHVPNLQRNLLSAVKLTDIGYNVKMNSKCAEIREGDDILLAGDRIGNLYQLSVRVETLDLEYIYNLLTSNDMSLMNWHKRMGHLNLNSLKKLAKLQHSNGLKLSGSTVHFCESCVQAKHTRNSFKSVRHRASKVMELIHSDVKVFPKDKTTHEGFKYFVSFIDDYSRYTFIYLLRRKNEVFEKFKEFEALTTNLTDSKIKQLRVDGGSEYEVTNAFKDFCIEKGIHVEVTPPYTSELNGCAERMNRTLSEMAMGLLIESHLSPDFIGDALLTAVYLRNRCLSNSIPEDRTPYEIFNKKAPNYSRLRVFGCTAWALIPKENRKKFESKSVKCVFVGYCQNRQAYKLVEVGTLREVYSRDVIFNEQEFPGKTLFKEAADCSPRLNNTTTSTNDIPSNSNAMKLTDTPIASNRSMINSDSIEDKELKNSLTGNNDSGGASGQNNSTNNANDSPSGNLFKGLQTNSQSYQGGEGSGDNPMTTLKDSQNQGVVSQDSVKFNRGVQENKKRKIYDDDDYVGDDSQNLPSHEDSRFHYSGDSFNSNSNDSGAYRYSKRLKGEDPEYEYIAMAIEECQSITEEPLSYKQAVSGPDRKLWKKAIQEEYDSLIRNQTWELTELPVGRKAIGCKWIFKVKRCGRFKARLVVQGYSQQQGIDYFDTFSPVAKWDSIRLLLSIAASEDWHIHQMDVKTAFLHSTLNETIYMKQPEGYRKESCNHVCKLKKSIYGLKQAPLVWNENLNSVLVKSEFKRCIDDPCLYRNVNSNGITIIAVYVDDIVITGSNMKCINDAKELLSKNFDMTDIGELTSLLGVKIIRDRKKKVLYLNQEDYSEKLLEKFGMKNCREISTPLASGGKLTKDMSPKSEEEKEAMAKIPYREVVGSLMYLMIATRPDLATSVGVVSKFLDCYGQEHWQAVKRILRYLRGTSKLSLQLGGENPEVNIVGFSDADYGGDVDDGKSTSGFVIKLGSGVISWLSKKQPTVACSTTESEYIALWETSKHCVWLRTLLEELGYEQNKPTVINEDNQGCIFISKYPKINARTKHINVKFHYIRELVNANVISVQYCNTKNMIADIMTKGLDKILFRKFRDELGLHEMQFSME